MAFILDFFSDSRTRTEFSSAVIHLTKELWTFVRAKYTLIWAHGHILRSPNKATIVLGTYIKQQHENMNANSLVSTLKYSFSLSDGMVAATQHMRVRASRLLEEEVGPRAPIA
ncbi:hypothetical protein AA313_de0201168 [Arthrobotrys entomopaga]|nr:hypothetical protein AA313_de0201168 [Arthrobotrys entomopaga]